MTPFQRLIYVTLPSIADVLATALLLRTIWVANSLDVILVMTGGGPGYATHTLPLYSFLRAYSSMEFGYGAALALVLTFLLLAVVWLYVRRASKGSGAMIERRSRTRRFLEVELPVLLIVLFAIAPYAWMILTSIKPQAELSIWPVQYLPREATLQHYRDLISRTSFAGNLANSMVIACGSALIGLGVSIPAAYAFSRFRFRDDGN